jgi:hypothetical protein
MGGFDNRASGPGVPGAPRLRVNGFAMMGGVSVVRKPAAGGGKRAVGDAERPELDR